MKRWLFTILLVLPMTVLAKEPGLTVQNVKISASEARQIKQNLSEEIMKVRAVPIQVGGKMTALELQEIDPGSAALKVGFRVKDQVIRVNDTEMTSVMDALAASQDVILQKKCEALILRDGKRILLKISVDSSKPKSAPKKKG